MFLGDVMCRDFGRWVMSVVNEIGLGMFWFRIFFVCLMIGIG